MIRFYYASGSPFAWRVHLALEEKALGYEPQLLSFQAGDLKKPEYLAINPHGKVPALVDADTSLYESQAILEYLEDRYPKPALLPGDPAARARTRIEELECVLYFSEVFRRIAQQAFFTRAEERDEKALALARSELRSLLLALDGRAAARTGEFMMGASLTRADVTWIPFVEIAARGGVDLEPPAMPWLAAWRARMRARPTYQNSFPPHWRK